MTVGILALQGDFARHGAVMDSLSVEWREVRRIAELEGCRRLIMPGGESTTILKFFEREPWIDSLREFGRSHPILGTCAGAILMAETVENPPQPAIGLIPMTVRRNAYGRQVDSFVANLGSRVLGELDFPAVFIRAPRIVRVGTGVEILARNNGDPVLVRCGHHMATTFHPELTDDPRIHRIFLEMG